MELFGVIATAIGGGLAVDGSGNVGLYSEGGGGRGFGAKGSLGLQITGTNANQITDLRGPFVNGSIGGGEGLAGSINTTFGQSNGSPIVGGGVTLGGGAGGGASTTITNTNVRKSFNVWDALGIRRRSQNGCR
ncbi:MAG: hypothetical protein H0V31_08195 [Acidobacteria bacterium]|nr:hypothetical protein [Acidobacteriota bacterium]